MHFSKSTTIQMFGVSTNNIFIQQECMQMIKRSVKTYIVTKMHLYKIVFLQFLLIKKSWIFLFNVSTYEVAQLFSSLIKIRNVYWTPNL